MLVVLFFAICYLCPRWRCMWRWFAGIDEPLVGAHGGDRVFVLARCGVSWARDGLLAVGGL
jgi:hypothetical protein